MANQSTKQASWANQWTFVMAATGSAVGLGNIWKFPYITGEYGGGAFVLVYLGCILLVGIPVMIAEVLIGRRGRSDPIHSMQILAKEADLSRTWRFLATVVGATGVLAGLIILSFYSVVAGWALDYVVEMGNGSFTGASPDRVGDNFTALLTNATQLITAHTVFIIMTGLVVAFGVTAGLGNAVRVMMPLLLLLLLVLLGFSFSNGDVDAAINFMFAADFSKITGEALLVALGHSFFTLSIGMGAIMAYGSYMPGGISIMKTVGIVALMDTLIALAAGMSIFPIVYANGLEPGSGPGLMFVTLPIAFGHMAGGMLFGTLFFILVCIAAWSSSISLIEPGVAWLERLGLNRWLGTALLSLLAWLGGLACIYSNNWLDDKPKGGLYAFETLDHLASNIMLPLGGLMMAIFVGWIIKRNMARKELIKASEIIFNCWYVILRFIAPAGVLAVFAYSMGWIKF